MASAVSTTPFSHALVAEGVVVVAGAAEEEQVSTIKGVSVISVNLRLVINESIAL